MPDLPAEDSLISRVAEAAKTVVDDSTAVLKAESSKIDAENFEVMDAIGASTKLFNVGITGVTKLARVAIEEPPPPTTIALGEYVVSVVQRMISQTGAVAQLASAQIEDKKYTPNRWLDSMTRMADIAIAGSMEIVETLVAGPARFEEVPRRSDPFNAEPSKNKGTGRTLSLTSLQRDATNDQVGPDRITIDPPVLTDPNVTFTFLVDPKGLASGVYRGTVVVDDGTHVKVQIAL